MNLTLHSLQEPSLYHKSTRVQSAVDFCGKEDWKRQFHKKRYFVSWGFIESMNYNSQL